MTPSTRLTRLVIAVVSRSLPKPIGADAAADLVDDYRRRHSTRGPLRATIWLCRETLALTATFLIASLKRALRSTVILRRDVIHALRSLSRRPASSLGAVVMLAVGLAAVAGAWGLASALLFKPLSTVNPDQVRRIAGADRTGRTVFRFSEVELEIMRSGLAGVADLSAVYLQPIVLKAQGTDTQTMAELVDGNYFSLLGIEVRAGRRLMALDAAPGAEPVTVISDTIWRDQFRRDPGVVGTTVRINGHAFTVIGVAVPGATGTSFGGGVDAWISTAHAGMVLNRDWRTNVDDRFWTAFGRTTPEGAVQVESALARTSSDLARQWPDPWRDRRLITAPATVLVGSQRGGAIALSLVLGALALLILATAAANVGGLLLANAAADRSRAAVLLSIGAGRAGIIRRHLIEGGALGMAAGVVALVIYEWVRRQLVKVTVLPTLSLNFGLPFDGSVVAITIAAGTLTGIVLALGPAIWTVGLDMAETLRDGSGRTSGSAKLSKARRLLVGAQVATSLTLLVGALVLARSVATLSAADIGFPRAGLVAMDFDLEPSVPEMSALPAMARDALRRAVAVPGVTAAAMSNRAPIDFSTPTTTVVVPGEGGKTLTDVTFYLATERYFETVGLRLVRGRAFTSVESDHEADVAIVNEAAAERLFANGDAIDRAIVLQPQGRSVRIVGIAQNSKYRSLSEPQGAHLYLPTAPNFGRALLVRTSADPRQTLRAVQQQLDLIGPGVVGFFPRTLDDHLAIDMLPVSASARASATLGAFALFLSGAGLYGIVMWFVEVRRREIGVRVALGASANQVRRLVVRQALVAAAPGVAVGLVMAIALTAFGRSLFVGIGAIDPMSLLVGVATLAAIVLAASYLPSRRATQVDPVIVLKDS